MGEREGEEGEIGRGEGVVTELQASVVPCGANARACVAHMPTSNRGSL